MFTFFQLSKFSMGTFDNAWDSLEMEQEFSPTRQTWGGSQIGESDCVGLAKEYNLNMQTQNKLRHYPLPYCLDSPRRFFSILTAPLDWRGVPCKRILTWNFSNNSLLTAGEVLEILLLSNHFHEFQVENPAHKLMNAKLSTLQMFCKNNLPNWVFYHSLLYYK